jgi:hypothetical protein
MHRHKLPVNGLAQGSFDPTHSASRQFQKRCRSKLARPEQSRQKQLPLVVCTSIRRAIREPNRALPAILSD